MSSVDTPAVQTQSPNQSRRGEISPPVGNETRRDQPSKEDPHISVESSRTPIFKTRPNLARQRSAGDTALGSSPCWPTAQKELGMLQTLAGKYDARVLLSPSTATLAAYVVSGLSRYHRCYIEEATQQKPS